jgi:hypothetical protein
MKGKVLGKCTFLSQYALILIKISPCTYNISCYALTT